MKHLRLLAVIALVSLQGCRSAEAPRIVSAADRERAVHAAQRVDELIVAGDLDAAVPILDDVLELDPLAAQHRITAARLLCAKGLRDEDPKLYGEGVRHADVACAFDPDNAAFLAERGRLQFERRYYTHALQDLRRATELRPEDIESWRRMALAHRGLRQPKAERRAWEALFAAAPHDAHAHYELARALLFGPEESAEDDVPRGLLLLERAAVLAPDDSIILHALADQRARAGDLTGAEALLVRAVSTAGEPMREQDALVSLGACVQAQQRWSDARAYYERALEIDRDDPRALANMGVVLMQLGEKREGRRHLEAAQELEPDERVKAAIDRELKRDRDTGDAGDAEPGPDAAAESSAYDKDRTDEIPDAAYGRSPQARLDVEDAIG